MNHSKLQTIPQRRAGGPSFRPMLGRWRNPWQMWIIAFELVVVFAGSTLLTPLYLLYRNKFGFGEIMLTLVYAAYVVGNLLALFFFGRLSDQIGRKTTTWPALAVAALSTLAFAFAPGTSWLFVGRILSGFATGLATGAATAWITELHPGHRRGSVRSCGTGTPACAGSDRRSNIDNDDATNDKKRKQEAAVIAVGGNLLGLALGPLMAGLLARYAPFPLRLSFFVYLALLAVAALAVSRVPDTMKKQVSQSRQLSLAPRLGVPPEIRMQFLAPAVTGFAIMSLVGFYAALVPGLLAHDLHRDSPAVSGVVVFAFFLVAAATDFAVRTRLKSGAAMLAGLGLLFPSLAFLLLAQAERSMLLLALGTAIGGIAAALSYFGSLEVVNEIAPAQRRSEVLSSYMIFCYLGNSVPVIGIGMLSGISGSFTAHVIFAAVVAALAAVGLVTGVKYAPEPKTQASGKEEPKPRGLRAS